MYVNVSQLLKASIGSSRTLTLNEDIDNNNLDRIEGNVQLTRTNQGILAKCSVQAFVTTHCIRCLDSVKVPVNLDIEEEFYTKINMRGGLPSVDQQDNNYISEGHVLNLNDVIMQYAILATPMKVLCRPDCAGICPSCGQNLNTGSCFCSMHTNHEHQPRLSNLKKEERT